MALYLYLGLVDATIFVAPEWGRVVRTPGRHGYAAFVPAAMPRDLPLTRASQLALSVADLAVGRLAGAGRLLPNPSILITPFSSREALESSRIEGTQTSLSEVYAAAASETTGSVDVREVRNYLSALGHGLKLLDGGLPLSLRVVRAMHEILLAGVRGEERTPGDFRSSQNWIGPAGATLETAVFVPPPVAQMHDALRDWERFPHDDVRMPVLVQCALLHYQFETIHPFLDGNGRLGRLFVILFLIERDVMPSPLLYLSAYFERRRQEYYSRLQGVRERGEFDEWLVFFLEGVAEQAADALTRAERLADLRERYRDVLAGQTRSRAHEVVDLLFENPVLTGTSVARRLGVTGQSGINLCRQLERAGLVQELDRVPGRRLRWVAREILDAIEN